MRVVFLLGVQVEGAGLASRAVEQLPRRQLLRFGVVAASTVLEAGEAVGHLVVDGQSLLAPSALELSY